MINYYILNLIQILVIVHEQANHVMMVSNPHEEAVVVPEVFRSYNISSEDAAPPRVQPSKKKGRVRPPSQTYDHIVAERRRREQLSQLFVALSALVPGLKKVINYLFSYYYKINYKQKETHDVIILSEESFSRNVPFICLGYINS